MGSCLTIGAATAVVFFFTTLVGCTPARIEDVEDGAGASDAGGSTGSKGTELHVMSGNQKLFEFDLQDESVLAQSSNLSKSIDTSAFTSQTGRVAIYSDCVGSGRITISRGAGTETSCDCRASAQGAMHRDDRVIDASERYSASVSMSREQPWAATITESPAELPAE